MAFCLGSRESLSGAALVLGAEPQFSCQRVEKPFIIRSVVSPWAPSDRRLDESFKNIITIENIVIPLMINFNYPTVMN